MDKGMVAIITGAAGGIGSATARLLHGRGMKLVLADTNSRLLGALASGLGPEHLPLVCDITKPSDVRSMVKKALRRYGRIDVLVNNAGIIFPNLFENCSYQEIEKQIAVNLMGPITCAKEVIPVMKEQGGGSIVTVSSLAGIVPETYSSIYAATKFALRGFNLTLRLELKRYKIYASAVFPDSVNTSMLKYEMSHGGSPLTFLNAPQSPDMIARAVYRAISGKKAEICVPASTGFFSKLLMAFPSLVMMIWPRLERMGQKKKDAMQKAGFF